MQTIRGNLEKISRHRVKRSMKIMINEEIDIATGGAWLTLPRNVRKLKRRIDSKEREYTRSLGNINYH